MWARHHIYLTNWIDIKISWYDPHKLQNNFRVFQHSNPQTVPE